MNIINVLIEMLASIIAHGLASKDHFNTFLTRGLYDPRLLVNYIYPFQGVFADASVDKFIEYASCIAEINHLDYQKTYQNLMSQNLSPALLHDNQELFVHIILAKSLVFQHNANFHSPYKKKCFEWCYKNIWHNNGPSNQLYVMDYAYLMDKKQLIGMLYSQPQLVIHFSNLESAELELILLHNMYILYNEQVRYFYKNLFEVYSMSSNYLFITELIEYIELVEVELFKQEEIILKNFNMSVITSKKSRDELIESLEQELSLCELRIINQRTQRWQIIKKKYNDKYFYFIRVLNNEKRLLNCIFGNLNNQQSCQIKHDVLCKPTYYIYVCWLHKRYDIIYALYYQIDFEFQTVRLPPINTLQFQLALPKIKSQDDYYHLYALCFINNRTNLVEQLDKIDYHKLLLKIALLTEEKKYFDMNSGMPGIHEHDIVINQETKFIIRRFLQPSKLKTSEDKSNITFLIRASVLEDEKPDRILADIQIRLLELGAFDILDRFTVLADDLWIRAVNSLNYYAMKYLLGRGFRPIGNENITGGQCYDLIRVA